MFLFKTIPIAWWSPGQTGCAQILEYRPSWIHRILNRIPTIFFQQQVYVENQYKRHQVEYLQWTILRDSNYLCAKVYWCQIDGHYWIKFPLQVERRKFDFLDRLIFPIRENRAMDAVKSMKLDLYLLMFVSAEFHRDTPPIVQGPGSIPSQCGSRLLLRVPLLYILQGKIYVIKNSSSWLRKKTSWWKGCRLHWNFISDLFPQLVTWLSMIKWYRVLGWILTS